jgi:ATP-binding cassette subfamily F protein 3
MPLSFIFRYRGNFNVAKPPQVNTVKAWLSVLENTFQIIVIEPYIGNLRTRQIKTPKVYFIDTGVVCHLTGLKDADHAAYGPMAKTLFETAVLLEITKAAGTIAIKPSLSVGYLDQAGAELNPENTVLEEASSVIPGILPEQMRRRLGAFMFVKDDVFKSVSDLSGGERNRLALCKLVLSEPEVLILDEPTNHLDIPSIEALENALADYTGTIIIISHDRFFLNRTVQRLIVLGADELGKMAPGKFEFIEGSFRRYTELLEQRSEQVTEKQAAPEKSKQDKPRKTIPPELKQFNGWKADKIEQAIEETEAKIKELHESFGDEKVYKDYKLLASVQSQAKEKEQYLELLYRVYELRTSS